MNTYRVWMLAGLLGFLGACSSSDGGDDDGGSDFDSGSGDSTDQGSSGSATKMGTVIVAEVEDEDLGSVVGATATFAQYDEAFEVPTTTSGLFDQFIGTCEISDSGEDEDDTPLPTVGPDDDTDFTFIDAGDTVSVTSAGDSYLSLSRIEFAGAIFYSTENLLSGPMASDLMLEIPGAAFPAASVGVESVETMVVTAPTAGSSVRFDTEFTWEAGSNDQALVLISADDDNVSVDCFVEDDGSFSFPTDTQNALGTAFVASDFSVARMAVDFYYNSSEQAALLVLSSSIR